MRVTCTLGFRRLPTSALAWGSIWRAAGLFRTREALQDAVAWFDANYVAARSGMLNNASPDADAWRRFNLLTVARLIARAALRREESRGAHFRADFPERDDLHWKVHLIEQQQ